MSDLEREAREAAEAYALKCWPESAHRGGAVGYADWISDVRHNRQEGYEDGYLAAAKEAEQEIATLRARVAELESRNGKWRSAFEGARDAILCERGPLEGESAGSDFINAVLGILDDEFSVVVPPIPLPEVDR